MGNDISTWFEIHFRHKVIQLTHSVEFGFTFFDVSYNI